MTSKTTTLPFSRRSCQGEDLVTGREELTHADVDVPLLDRITTAKDAEEEGDEEDKKRVDLKDKVTLELTARLIIA